MPFPVFVIRQTYNFEVYPNARLQTKYDSAIVLALMDFETAVSQGLDAQGLHINLYPSLPGGTPNDPRGYDYVKIKLPTGQSTILGLAWIKTNTVELVESRTITVKISNSSADKVQQIRDSLVQNGFTVSSIEVSS